MGRPPSPLSFWYPEEGMQFAPVRRLIIHPCGMSVGANTIRPYMYPANLAGIPDAPPAVGTHIGDAHSVDAYINRYSLRLRKNRRQR